MDINTLVKLAPNPNIPTLNPGDIVKVTVKVVEGEKQRNQLFQGVVIRVRRGTNNAAFTVRRVTHGIGVERTFMVHSPLVEKVELVRRGDVRRARLFYLRGLSTKEARLKEKGKALAEVLESSAAQPDESQDTVNPEAPSATAEGATASATEEAKAEKMAKAKVEPKAEAAAPAEAK
ncbi:MAG: 50S ribosomal protein L19 [Chloroflexi bacterium]|nr:50S ribosomal protein L19 [Chloroflexota bacterium]